jgi:hypothetical protein
LASGGFRANAGRPPGLGTRVRGSLKPNGADAIVTGPQSVRPVTKETAERRAISYLASVLADPTASSERKDRCAIALLGLARIKTPPKRRPERDPIEEALAGIGIPSY